MLVLSSHFRVSLQISKRKIENFEKKNIKIGLEKENKL